MSNDNIKRVGVEFVAQGAAQYVAATNNATKAEQAFTAATVQSAQAASEAISFYTLVIKTLLAQGNSVKEVTATLKSEFGATKDVTAALSPYIDAEKKAAAAAKEAAAAATAAAKARATEEFESQYKGRAPRTYPSSEPPDDPLQARQGAVALARFHAEMARGRSTVSRYGDHFTSLSSSIGASRVGVALFIRELSQMAGGSTVAVQALSSFVYATGTLGIALAAVTSGLILLKAAFDVDKQVKALNDELERLGKHGDAAEGLAKLTGVSNRNAAATLEYLKANQELAASFRTQATAVQPTIPLLQELGDATRYALEQYAKFYHVEDFTKATQSLSNSLRYAAVFAQAYSTAISQGQSVTQAGVTAAYATAQAMGAQNRAVEELTWQTRLYAQIQNEINATTTRVSIANSQEAIDKLRLEGASVDELRLAYLRLLQQKREVGTVSAGATGVGPIGAPIGIDSADAAIEAAKNNYSFLNSTANRLAKDLLAVQRQYNDQSASLAEDHKTRIAQIASSYHDQQVRMARDHAQRMAEIESNLAQDRADAASDYAERVRDAEESVGERRTEIARDYADRRAEIEKEYQERVADIQSDYQASLFDIVARDDAKGLVRARLQRTKALADAVKDRDKQLAKASESHAKQEKDLSDSLEKQKRKLAEDYARRLRDLEQAAAKQRTSANQSYADQLADLKASTDKQYAAENDAYEKSKRAAAKAYAERQQALIDALNEMVKTNKEYGLAIINSLKDILDPAVIRDLLAKFNAAIQAEIKITVTPFNAGGAIPAPVFGPTPYAMGGHIAANEYAYLHARETVLPADNPMRAYALAEAHMSRMSVPMGGRGGRRGGAGTVTLYIDNSLNSALLSSQIRTVSTGIVTEVVTRAKTR